MTTALASLFDETIAAGWLLYSIRSNEILVMVDPNSDTALDEALMQPEFTGCLKEWHCRLVGFTPIGWEVLVFDRVHLVVVPDAS